MHTEYEAYGFNRLGRWLSKEPETMPERSCFTTSLCTVSSLIAKITLIIVTQDHYLESLARQGRKVVICGGANFTVFSAQSRIFQLFFSTYPINMIILHQNNMEKMYGNNNFQRTSVFYRPRKITILRYSVRSENSQKSCSENLIFYDKHSEKMKFILICALKQTRSVIVWLTVVTRVTNSLCQHVSWLETSFACVRGRPSLRQWREI